MSTPPGSPKLPTVTLRTGACIGAGLLATCIACFGPRAESISNTSCAVDDVDDAYVPSKHYFRVPAPDLLPDVDSIMVLAHGETVQHIKLCAADGSAVLASDWGRVLKKERFAVQIADSGWEGSGPLALRFRKDDVIGDIFASADGRGCRNYTIRTQVVTEADAVHWSTPFGGSSYLDARSHLKTRFHRCIRFFSEDIRFPIDAAEYSWGCP